MSVDDSTAGLEERLRQLVELRKIEEQKYGELLTRLDQIWQFQLPQETKPRIPEIKNHLNRTFDYSAQVPNPARSEERPFWKEVARSFIHYFEPFLQHQKEVNSLTVHLFNEHIEAVQESLSEIRQFHNTLILYFQRIVPVVDTKFREMTGTAENFQLGLRDFSELMFQQLDRKIMTLQVDVETLQALRDTVRSLSQTMNSALSSEHPQTPDFLESDGSTPFLLREVSREEIKDRFTPFVRFFENTAGAPVLDASCGTGEFLELLKEASVDAFGVDARTDAVRYCEDLGLRVKLGDPLQYLESQPENSLGGFFCSRGADYFSPETLLALLRLAFTRLKQEAPLLLHSVNANSGSAFLNEYTRDPGRIKPLHPEALKFLITATGFQQPEILFVDPVPAIDRLRSIASPQTEEQLLHNENIDKLNRLLFGMQNFAVLARK